MTMQRPTRHRPPIALRFSKCAWRARGMPAMLAIALLGLTSSLLTAEECCDPRSPFRAGEAITDTPATCENLAHWASKAPSASNRVSMVVTGRLSGVHSDGVLAYLEMCDPKGLRVVCVTYETNGMYAGETVTFAGGYVSTNDEWVKLDPCLASR